MIITAENTVTTPASWVSNNQIREDLENALTAACFAKEDAEDALCDLECCIHQAEALIRQLGD
jgi:hypothetical protein